MLRLRFFPFWLSNKLGFNIFIHLFLQSDDDTVHDHPWPSTSVLLWGKIRERRQERYSNLYGDLKVREWITARIPKFKRIRREATYRHAIVLDSKWALTIFIPKEKERTWYFWPEGKPVHWKTFLGHDESM
jgi:hypothetical protein